MRILNRILGSLLLLAGVVAQAAAAGADASGELAALLAKARTLEARFAQDVRNDGGELLQHAEGVMQVARPQLFRWEVQSPMPQLIVADDSQVQVYDPDLLQVVVRPLDAQLSATPTLLFSGDAGRIARHFAVSSAGKGVYRLRPLDADAVFESLDVQFRGDVLAVMELRDALGQTTRITFRDVKLNRPLDPALFTFTPPPGVDVVRELP